MWANLNVHTTQYTHTNEQAKANRKMRANRNKWISETQMSFVTCCMQKSRNHTDYIYMFAKYSQFIWFNAVNLENVWLRWANKVRLYCSIANPYYQFVFNKQKMCPSIFFFKTVAQRMSIKNIYKFVILRGQCKNSFFTKLSVFIRLVFSIELLQSFPLYYVLFLTHSLCCICF